MTLDRQVRAFAGGFVLASLALGRYLDPRARWVTAFVGANLLQSAFTGFCPLERLLERVERRRHAVPVTVRTGNVPASETFTH